MQTVTVELTSLDLETFKKSIDHGTEIVLTRQGNPVAHVVPVAQGRHNDPVADPILSDDKQIFTKVVSTAAHLHTPFDEADQAMQSEIAAFEAEHASLIATYEDEYVAMHQGEVVDHDVEVEPLLTRINTKYPDETVLIRQVARTLPSPLRIRSPRFTAAPDE